MTLEQLLRMTKVLATLAVAMLWAGRECSAMPMFARRYNVPCSTCHTSPPRLNETGYRFRAAGFRMPEELGQATEVSTKLSDHIGFRLQPRVDVIHSAIGPLTKNESDVELFASEGYLWYGPISKHFSASAKLTFWPDESNETELHERLEGTLRFDYGSADNFIDIRAGVPHPVEGFGGSESYSVSNSKPFIEDLRTANFNQDTFFTPLGLHQMALSVGYYHKRTTIKGSILSGMRLLVGDDDNELKPFGRKEPLTKATRGSHGGPDFQIFFNQILHPDGGNVSVYYYDGRSSLPRLDLLPSHQPSDSFDEATHLTKAEAETVPFFKSNFRRLALYAGYPIRKVSFLGGVQYGTDTIGSGGRFSSCGSFVEANVKVINDISVAGVRFDWFDPARIKPHDELTGVTPYINVWLFSQLRIAAEYQYRVGRRGPFEAERKDHQFQLRLYWIK
jgi:hypothetical protein